VEIGGKLFKLGFPWRENAEYALKLGI